MIIEYVRHEGWYVWTNAAAFEDEATPPIAGPFKMEHEAFIWTQEHNANDTE